MRHYGSYIGTGIDPSTVVGNLGMTVAMRDFDEKSIERRVRVAKRNVNDIALVEIGFDIRGTKCLDSATLVKAVAQAASLGVRRINISNYGEMPLNRLAWIKQAGRYVNRELS
jgi:hypothetical protein